MAEDEEDSDEKEYRTTGCCDADILLRLAMKLKIKKPKKDKEDKDKEDKDKEDKEDKDK